MDIKVSIVIATYLRSEELKRALDSLAKQTYNNIEIIVVDDSGKSEWNAAVSETVGSFAQTVSFPVRLITNETNRGSAESRNIGIKAAQGEYVTFLDDDDVYLPDKVKNQLESMLENNSDFSITDLCLYTKSGKLSDKRVRDYIKSYSSDKLLGYHLMYHMTGTDCLMFKKSYLDKIGGFPPINVGDEFYLMSNAIQAGGRLSYLPRCDVKAYIHCSKDGGLSSGIGKVDGENRLFEYKKQFFQGLSKKSVKYIKMRHYAVLAFAYYRMRNWKRTLKYGMASFFEAPVFCIKLLVARQSSAEGCL